MMQSFYLIWLDDNINRDSEQYRNSIAELHQVVNTVHTFDDIDECIDFITGRSETAFVIVQKDLLLH